MMIIIIIILINTYGLRNEWLNHAVELTKSIQIEEPLFGHTWHEVHIRSPQRKN